MNKKIKILETIRQGKVGGGETHVLELCTNLNKILYEVVVLSFTNGPMVEELRKRGIRTEVIYTETGFDFRVWRKVLKFIQSEKFDIIHAHGTRAMSNVFWASKRLGLPLIYTVHGWSFHPDQSFVIHKVRELSEFFLTSVATKTICVSKNNETDGIKRFNMKRSKVIYNAIDLEKFNPEKEFKDIRGEFGIPADQIIIGFVLRITLQKDPLTMIRAMKILCDKKNNVMLLMVGDGDLKEETLKLTHELKLNDKVIFKPFRSDIPDILNAIDIYCLPSLWEGFPIGVLEAMAMKKCVVASPVDGTIELVKDKETGLLIETKNAEKWAETLLLLCNDKDERYRLAANSANFVRNNFEIKNLLTNIEEVYQKFIH